MYRLGAGDQLHVIPLGEEQLTGEFRVGATGDIALPLLGHVHAANFTVPELERAIEDQMRNANSSRDPNVMVEVIGCRPVFVLGEVAKPGEYSFQPGMTVVTAVAVSGGFTYRAIKDEFSIVRAQQGAAVEGHAGRQTAVQPGM